MAEEAQKCVLDFFRSFLYESYEKCEEKNQNDIVVKPKFFHFGSGSTIFSLIFGPAL